MDNKLPLHDLRSADNEPHGAICETARNVRAEAEMHVRRAAEAIALARKTRREAVQWLLANSRSDTKIEADSMPNDGLLVRIRGAGGRTTA